MNDQISWLVIMSHKLHQISLKSSKYNVGGSVPDKMTKNHFFGIKRNDYKKMVY